MNTGSDADPDTKTHVFSSFAHFPGIQDAERSTGMQQRVYNSSRDTLEVGIHIGYS